MVRTGWDIIVVPRTRHGRNTILPIARIPYELHLRLANSHAHTRRRRAWLDDEYSIDIPDRRFDQPSGYGAASLDSVVAELVAVNDTVDLKTLRAITTNLLADGAETLQVENLPGCRTTSSISP